MDAFDQNRIRQFYDRFGAKQDSQGFYEDAAFDALVRNADFGEARSVLEIGCGTGRFAASLLAGVLPADARYVGIDISTTMVALARDRLAPWQGRAEVHHADGGFDLGRYGGPFDRVVVAYVLDLLSPAQIRAALAGAHAALGPGGLLCTTCLTKGTGPLSRTVSTVWAGIHGVAPYLVGGCRPLVLADFLAGGDWRIRYREVIVSTAVPSEVIVAEAVDAADRAPG